MKYTLASLIGGLAITANASTEPTLLLSHDAKSAAASNRVDVDLENTTDHEIFVLGYHTVFEKPEGRTTGAWLHVSDSFGREVPYIGRYVVNGAFVPESFIRVRPGDHLKGSVDLTTEYELPPAGNVTVTTEVAVYDRVPGILRTGENEDVPSTTIESDSLTFPIIGGATRPTSIASTLKCLPDQLDSTRRAIVAAQAASLEAINFLGSLYYHDPIDPANPVAPRIHMRPHFRYMNWYGNWDEFAPQAPEPGWESTDNSSVDQTVAAVYARLLFGASTVCDECAGYSPLSRAWAEGPIIHLCPVNFTDPITGGITSQAGTIVHEVSHRSDGYGKPTVDVPGVSSRDQAHRLARPQAVRSAANYEYFITNTPLGY